MNKKVYILFLGFILSFGLFSSVFSQATTETLTITTYYPSPYGSYKQLSVTESGAQTTTNYALYLTNTATSSTASINKYGMYISSTGTWNGASANNYGLYIASPSGGTNNYGMVVAGGNVGIGMTPTVQFELSGNVGQKASGTTWSNPSDSRIKDVLRPFSDGLKVIEGINPIYYKFNGKGGIKPDGEEYIGVVAQEIQRVAPYTVSSYKAKLNEDDKEDTDLLRFDAHALTFIMINAIKEQQKEIEELKSEIAGLRAQLKSRSK